MAFITVDGENQIALKQGGGGSLNIVNFVLANITGLDPNNEPANRIESMPAGGDIMATVAVTKSGYVNTNQVVYSTVMDSSVGDFDFNWVGLVDDEGVLIAATYIPLTQKRATAGAVPGNNLTRNFLIAFSGIQATTAIAVSAETWQIDFTARLLGIDERERLSNFDIYGHEGFFDTGFNVVRQGVSTVYDVLPGVGYVGGIRIASIVTQQVTADSPPESIWLDVSLQGDINGMSAVVAFAVDAVAHPDYTDGNGFDHYLTKIADIDASGNVTDVRVQAEGLVDHLAATDPHPEYLTEPEAGQLYKDINAVDAPVGSLLMMDGNIAPAGYLKRNGAVLSRATYAALWAYAQTISNLVSQATKDGDSVVYAGYYGDGDGSTTFTLPDARGEFIRAWDDGRGIDVGRAIGGHQLDALQDFSGSVSMVSTFMDNGPAGAGSLTVSNNINITSAVNSGGGPDDAFDLGLDPSLVARVADETRPRNTAYLFCVKY